MGMLHTLFAFEICARFEPNAPLHDHLRRLITTHPPNATLQQKWGFYRQVVQTLQGAVPLFDRGCWDYFDNDAKAQASYEQWVGGMVSEEGARTQPSGDDPYRGGQKYMTFTMAFLLVQSSPTDMALRRVCDIPEPQLWQRHTFARILDGLAVLNFASIKSDVAYLIPRDTGWGLTQDDLAQPKFHYLRPIV
jgi:hypothetical protein